MDERSTAGARLARLLLIGGVVVWFATGAVRCGSAAPLGHDEARYATDTRELVDGSGKRYVYVPVGMNVEALPGVLLGGGERSVRALPLIAGLVFLFAVWNLARRVTSRGTAAWVVAIVAGAHPITRFSADLLSDLPSAACLLTALAVLIPELTRAEGPRNRTVLAAPLCAAAFYVRYGSVGTIVIVAIVAVLVGGPGMLRRPRPVVLTIGLFVILLAPHVIYSMTETGSPVGVLAASAAVPGHAGEGLATYLTSNPLNTYGFVAAPVMLVGLLAFRRHRITIALQLIAVTQILVLGLTTHAQPRFVVLAIVLLLIVGVDRVRGRLVMASPRVATWVAGVATVAIVGTWVVALVAGHRAHGFRQARVAPVLLAAAAIKADAMGVPCEVAGQQTTLLAWYSGCRSTLSVNAEGFSDSPVYWVRVARDRALPTPPGVACPVLQVPGVVEVFRLRNDRDRCAAR